MLDVHVVEFVWLQNDLKSWTNDLINSSELVMSGLLNKNIVKLV